MIEKKFDIPFIADLALHEKQIQQRYRPIIAVHKWFARRPGTLFRGILLSEFGPHALNESYYKSNLLAGLKVADPFMGGGIPLLEANRLGCDVIGMDINPMSYWIVKQEIENLDLKKYTEAAENIREELKKTIGKYYITKCIYCGHENAQVKYFLWVKMIKCKKCLVNIDLFPGYLIATNSRHPKNIILCSMCGQLNEVVDRNKPGNCSYCNTQLLIKGNASRNSCDCPNCGTVNKYPEAIYGPPKHRLFAIEYYCHKCDNKHVGRFFKVPDKLDISCFEEATKQFDEIDSRFIPEDEIPAGDESNRLHRWGYKYYREMFNVRQLLGLELSARLISLSNDERVRNALATNLSDLLRYQNMLCRYDSSALKSLDIFSVHGFPVGLIQCESNILGIISENKKMCIGSGGWKNITEKYYKAKSYCMAPFEVRQTGTRKQFVPIHGEWIGERKSESKKKERMVDLRCGDSAFLDIPENTLDAVVTDPPYFKNVQYAELMDFCYIWLRKIVGKNEKAFKKHTTRNDQELTGNENMKRDIEHFTEGVSKIFIKMKTALKPGAPLVFTYHNNLLEAYFPIAIAILDAGLTCSATIPCPAEMSASIHINGTGSSIIDTVFVCRTKGIVHRKNLPRTVAELSALVEDDEKKLCEANVKLTEGDRRCMTYGHLIRIAIWHLRKRWDKTISTSKKISLVDKWIKNYEGLESIIRKCRDNLKVPSYKEELTISGCRDVSF